MIRTLELTNFKNFKNATLTLGPLTVLIGANASGKSNIRDAFRFLHGIGRGYSLAEILGEKYVGGERVWSGIRGGTREVTYYGTDTFALKVRFAITMPKLRPHGPHSVDYLIEVIPDAKKAPRIRDESLVALGRVGFGTER